MRIVEIAKLPNGSHRNQTMDRLGVLPEGWAVVPDEMVCENFPFGELDADKIDGVMTVTSWVGGTLPEPEVEPTPEPEPSAVDILNALLGVSE
jgi:hypothetical protein